MAKKMEYGERLNEIADTKIGELSDDQVLQLLAERKQLGVLQSQYEQAQKQQEQLLGAELVKTEIEKELEHLNALISPDKLDDELLHLIEERKVLEAKLDEAAAKVATFKTGSISTAEANVVKKAVPEDIVVAPEAVAEESLKNVSEDLPSTPPIGETAAVLPEKILQGSVEELYGEEKIGEIELDEGSELAVYLRKMADNISSIGKILDELPAEVKKNKVFMLEVAKIDPAYAMHYADKDILKMNEDFNLKVVALKNERQSGSVLAEMLPEARTGKVVMAAVKHDYHNVRFALPQMEEYDEIMEKAKKSTLDKVKEMKDSVDVITLIPKILQKDVSFMKKVEEVVTKR